MEYYQGLFYLLAGTVTYFVLLLIFRIFASKSETHDFIEDDENKWIDKESLTIVDIIDESRDVKTFRFKRTNKAPFSVFKAGQFLSFQIKNNPKLLRSYSISGSCENTSTLQVSIKRIEDGEGSHWFHQLEVGAEVFAFSPGGHFTDNDLSVEFPRVYVGGGIGITPLVSMIKTNIDRSLNVSMSLFYGMNSVNDLVFHEELLLLAKTYTSFNYYPILSPGAKDWEGDIGFISFDFINSKLEGEVDANTNFYFCGPPIMTDSISESLLANNHSEEFIHSEKFASPTSFDLDSIESIQAEIKIGEEIYQYDGKETLLDFLEDHSLDISFACRSGVCGDCRCQLLSGEVSSMTDSGLTKSQKDDKNILTCVSRPKSNLTLKLRS